MLPAFRTDVPLVQIAFVTLKLLSYSVDMKTATTVGVPMQADARGRLRLGDPRQFWVVTTFEDGSFLAEPAEVVTAHEAALNRSVEIATEVDRSLADSSQARPSNNRRPRAKK